MQRFDCPYLNSEVELTAERERHIAERHPDLLPEHAAALAETLLEPDAVRRSPRAPGARMFSRWYNNIRGGKHVVVVVMSGAGTPKKDWIVTAYLARRLAEGELEWKKD
ncbi:MAG: hypothetical protein AB1742_06940 [bacterium]